MSFVDFKALKERVLIEDAIALLGMEMKKSGEQYRSSCPRCGGSERTLVITPGKQAAYCFSARKGGDVIWLAAHVREEDLKDAAAFLDGGNSTSTGNGTSSRNGTSPKPAPQSARGKEGGRTLQPLAYLQSAHEAVEALGVESETADHFGAGYAPRGILRGRMAIPIHSAAGELLAYCGHAVKGESPTLTFPNGFRPEEHIFNAHRIEGGELYLVRDPLEVLLAYQAGIENVVSFLTETIQPIQLEALAALMDQNRCETVELY